MPSCTFHSLCCAQGQRTLGFCLAFIMTACLCSAYWQAQLEPDIVKLFLHETGRFRRCLQSHHVQLFPRLVQTLFWLTLSLTVGNINEVISPLLILTAPPVQLPNNFLAYYTRPSSFSHPGCRSDIPRKLMSPWSPLFSTR